MKTWEMIKELEKDNSKIFENSVGNRVRFDGLYLTWEVSRQQFVISNSCFLTDWKEVKKPMTFMEAVKTEKPIRVEYNFTDDEESREYRELDDFLDYLGGRYYEDVVREILLNGKFYIED